jgi:hypothetical protein
MCHQDKPDGSQWPVREPITTSSSLALINHPYPLLSLSLSLSHIINYISKLGNSGPQDEGSYIHPKHWSQIMRLHSAVNWKTIYKSESKSKVNLLVHVLQSTNCKTERLSQYTNTRHCHKVSVSGSVSVVSVYITSFNMGAPLWNSELWSDFCGQKAFKISEIYRRMLA